LYWFTDYIEKDKTKITKEKENDMAKKEKEKVEKKTSEEILQSIEDDGRHDDLIFSDRPMTIKTSLGEVEIKVWSLGEYARIGTVVEAMLKSFEDAGIDSTLLFMRPASLVYYENVMLPLSLGEHVDKELEEIYSKDVFAEQSQITRLFARAALPAMEIIRHACGWTSEEVETLDADEGLGIFNVIVMKNMSVLGKAFELFGKHLPE
jgi:hypothetical protein